MSNLNTHTSGILEELQRTVSAVDAPAVVALIERIVQADRIFLAGAGRSGLMMRAFAMRLMHMGFDAYVVGESVTPGIGEQGLLIIGSGSGETQSLIAMAEKAKRIGASVAVATIQPTSTIGKLADTILQIPASTKENTDRTTTIQPMGSLFEQSLLLVFDALILHMMANGNIDSAKMFGRHANLE